MRVVTKFLFLNSAVYEIEPNQPFSRTEIKYFSRKQGLIVEFYKTALEIKIYTESARLRHERISRRPIYGNVWKDAYGYRDKCTTGLEPDECRCSIIQNDRLLED